MSPSGMFGTVVKLVKDRLGASPNATGSVVADNPDAPVPTVDPDATNSFTAGPPGWIYPAALACIEIYARIEAGMGSQSWLVYLDKIGNTTVTLMGVMLAPFLAYRGYIRRQRARVAIAAHEATKAVADASTAQAQATVALAANGNGGTKP